MLGLMKTKRRVHPKSIAHFLPSPSGRGVGGEGNLTHGQVIFCLQKAE